MPLDLAFDLSLVAGGAQPAISLDYTTGSIITSGSAIDNAAWTKPGTGFTVTADAIAAPDGTTTADRLLEVAVSASHQISQAATFTAQRYEYSAFIKPITRQWARLQLYDGTSFKTAYFNVATGVVGTVDSGVVGTCRLHSSGFYRVAMNYTCAAGAGFIYFIGATADGGSDTYAGDAAQGYYLWGVAVKPVA